MVAETIANTLSCLKAKAQDQTESLTVVPVRAYTVVNTLNDVEADAPVYTQAYKFPQVQAKRVTITPVEGISSTLSVRE